jgi:hypothetical protein
MHIRTLKFHTIYTVALTVIFLVIALLAQEIILGVAMLFLLLYVAGNGIIHGRKNELTRDTLLEYIIISAIVIVMIIGAIF